MPGPERNFFIQKKVANNMPTALSFEPARGGRNRLNKIFTLAFRREYNRINYMDAPVTGLQIAANNIGTINCYCPLLFSPTLSFYYLDCCSLKVLSLNCTFQVC